VSGFQRQADRVHATLATGLSSPAALLVAGSWAFAEASFFFIVPDVFLGLVALFAPRRVARTLAAIAVAAVGGAALLVVISSAAPSGVAGFLDRLPAIGPDDLVEARAQLESQGFMAFLSAPLEGVPVKVYVHEATQLSLPEPLTLVFTALNRVERIGLFGLVMATVGVLGRSLIARFPRSVGVTYLAAWAAFYAAFWAARPG
jgi:hypothetical protein